ncbi:hypothetical protein KCV07_g1723, partial [Aureobasidium melanogenum]
MSETPILVGVDDIVNRHLAVHHAAEPAELMLDAIFTALQDTGLSPQVIATLKSKIDSIGVVRTWTWPYPDLPGLLAEKLDLAGAVILTSVSYARELGIAEDRWIYVLGGAGTQDSDNFWERPNLHSSPATRHTLNAGLEACGSSKTEIDMFDFYSCFPIVPKLARLHLGLDMLQPEKPITSLTVVANL